MTTEEKRKRIRDQRSAALEAFKSGKGAAFTLAIAHLKK